MKRNNDINLKVHRIFLYLFITISCCSCGKKIDIREIDNALLKKMKTETRGKRHRAYHFE